MIPYEGRYDAQPLSLFSVDKKDSVTAVHQPDLSDVKGQIRDIQWLRTAKGKLLVVAINNQPVQFYHYNK